MISVGNATPGFLSRFNNCRCSIQNRLISHPVLLLKGIYLASSPYGALQRLRRILFNFHKKCPKVGSLSEARSVRRRNSLDSLVIIRYLVTQSIPKSGLLICLHRHCPDIKIPSFTYQTLLGRILAAPRSYARYWHFFVREK